MNHLKSAFRIRKRLFLLESSQARRNKKNCTIKTVNLTAIIDLNIFKGRAEEMQGEFQGRKKRTVGRDEARKEIVYIF